MSKFSHDLSYSGGGRVVGWPRQEWWPGSGDATVATWRWMGMQQGGRFDAAGVELGMGAACGDAAGARGKQWRRHGQRNQGVASDPWLRG